MKKLIILFILIPALCWGMNPYIAGVVSGSGDESGYTTTVFSYDFDVPDGSDPTSVGAPIDTWTSESDADGDGNISGNAWVCTIDDANVIQLRKIFTAATDVQVSYDIKFSTLDIGSYHGNMTLRNSSSVYLSCTSYKSGATLDSLRISYREDSGAHYDYPNVTWAAGTSHTIVLTYKKSSGVDTSDGAYSVSFDGVIVSSSLSLDNDTFTGMTEIRMGSESYAADATETYDNVAVKTP